jgi:hypothetical protein
MRVFAACAAPAPPTIEVVAQYFSERLDGADLATLWRISLRLGR